MEATLIMPKDQQDYFVKYLEQKFDTVKDNMRELRKEVNENTELTKEVSKKQDYTNGKVIEHGKRLKALEIKRGLKFPTIQPAVLYLLALGGVVALLIVASLLGINLKGLL